MANLRSPGRKIKQNKRRAAQSVTSALAADTTTDTAVTTVVLTPITPGIAPVSDPTAPPDAAPLPVSVAPLAPLTSDLAPPAPLPADTSIAPDRTCIVEDPAWATYPNARDTARYCLRIFAGRSLVSQSYHDVLSQARATAYALAPHADRLETLFPVGAREFRPSAVDVAYAAQTNPLNDLPEFEPIEFAGSLDGTDSDFPRRVRDGHHTAPSTTASVLTDAPGLSTWRGGHNA